MKMSVSIQSKVYLDNCFRLSGSYNPFFPLLTYFKEEKYLKHVEKSSFLKIESISALANHAGTLSVVSQ